MPTLNIGGRKVKVGDEFLSLTPEQQNDTVDEITASFGDQPAPAVIPEDQEPKGDGLAMNATAGVNTGIYSTLGLPVDLARGAINLGIRGINAASGAELPTIRSDSFGGSESISSGFGAIGVPEPKDVRAATTGERVARGFGEGVGYTIAPEAAVGGLLRTGVASASPKIAELGGKIFGTGATTGQVATNAVVGGTSGLGASAAMENASEEWKPVAGILGGIGGGLAGAVATTTVPALASSVKRAAGEYVAPLSKSGREKIAGTRIAESATDLSGLRASLEQDPADLVPGSSPTTFQQTGDMGIGGLEREAQTRRPDLFNQRRAEQNSARIGALSKVQPGGAPETIATAARNIVRSVEDRSAQAFEDATNAARRNTEAVGVGASPEVVGDTMRARLEEARSAAKSAERELWSAVDPDGSLALPVANARKRAVDIVTTLPKSAKPPEGEEAAIYAAANALDGVVPFSEVTALQSRVKAEMRQERMMNGESPAYRRMTQLNSALESDIESAVSGRMADEAAAVEAGTMSEANTTAARVGALTAPKTGTKVYSPSGQSYDVDYQIVEASDLVSSNMADGSRNPSYPAGLQPRDRTRAASDVQISNIARNIEPERLGASSDLATGAPLIGPDNVVESGNGRVAAISRAYGENGKSAKAYRDYLASQGYKIDGMKNPVLVRRRIGELDDQARARLAQEANASQSLAMSASEQASTDASRLTPEILRLYRGGDISSAENRDFSRAFLGSVSDKGQEGAFVTGSGTLSLDGAARMRNALLASAYGDGRMIAALTDEGDENIRAFGRALVDAAGDVARLRSGIRSGDVEAKADVSPFILEAAGIVQKARASKARLADVVSQADAFNPISEGGLNVLRIAYGEDLAGRLSRERLAGSMRDAVLESEQQTAGARLFGEALDGASILAGVRARNAKTSQTQGRYSSSSNVGPRGDEVRPENGGSGSVPDRPQDNVRGGEEGGGTPGFGRSGRVDPGILPKIELAPNFDADAAKRLTDARSATRSRVETFDNKTLAPIRRRPSTVSPYDMAAGSIPQRIFTSGPGSVEAIGKLRAAVGDVDALRQIEDYAVDRLRKVALRDDGTLDPRRLDSWRRSHADALRAIPGLDRRLANAAQASRTMDEVAARQREVLNALQRSQLGKVMNLSDPEDVTRAVGSIFQLKDRNNQMGQLSRAVAGDPEARQGLRKAVVDHIMNKFVGNTEAATSGQASMRADQFQTFMKDNIGALRLAGFSDDELRQMAAIAKDLQRANRSLNAVKIPGQSNTAQDMTKISQGNAVVRDGDGPTSVLVRIIMGTAMGGGFAIGGFLGGAVGVLGAKTTQAFRDFGFETANDMIADAMLNPARARLLLSKYDPRTVQSVGDAFARVYRRSIPSTLGVVSGRDGQKEKE